MSDTRDMERLLADWMAATSPGTAPGDAVEAAIDTIRRRRPRPTWLATLRTLPMTSERRSLVGSPTARLIYLATTMLFATLIATAGLAVGVQLVDADRPATNGLIAFDAEGDIWLAAADGSNVRRLTETPEAERAPIWSPHGDRLAFIVASETGEDLVHVDATGGDRVTAARGLVAPSVTQQAWSPDGSRIAYSTVLEGGTWRVFVAQADGSGTRQLGDPELNATDPAWSPDGRSIAFQGGRGAEKGVYVMGSDGSDPRLIGPGDQVTFPLSRPFWSSDGYSILSSGPDTFDPFPGHDILVLRADGAREARILGGNDDYWASWSPDGRRIAWVHHLPSGVRVAFAAGDGTAMRVLGDVEIDRQEPVWSPDGRRVVVHLGPDTAGNDLGIVDPDGLEPMTVISVPRPGGVSWQRLDP